MANEIKAPSDFTGIHRDLFDAVNRFFSYGHTTLEIQEIVDAVLAWKIYKAHEELEWIKALNNA